MPNEQRRQGRYFEDFTTGEIYEHWPGRTILAADTIWFSLLTQNNNPLHIDAHYAAQTEFGRPLVEGAFTLALVTGQSVADISMNALANLGWDEVRTPQPSFRRRHRLFPQRGFRDPRIQVAPQRWDRAREDHRIQAGRKSGN